MTISLDTGSRSQRGSRSRPATPAGPHCGSTALAHRQPHLCPSRASTSRLITHARIRQDDTIRGGRSMSYDATYAGVPVCLARRSSAPSTVDGLLMNRPRNAVGCCRTRQQRHATDQCLRPDGPVGVTRPTVNQQAGTWTLGSGPPSSVAPAHGLLTNVTADGIVLRGESKGQPAS